MKQREACMALLVTLLILLLAGVVGVDAFRMLRQEGKRRELEADRQRVDALQQARLAARTQAGLGDTNILQAPEITAVSGREARMKAPETQVNSIPVQAGSGTPPR